MPVVGEGSGAAERLRREGPRRNRAGSPLQGGTGGPPPESFRWSSARGWPWPQAGRNARFSRSANDDAFQGAGRSVSRRAPRSCVGCVAFGFGSGWFRPPAGVFQPRAPPTATPKAARGAGPPSGGRAEPQPLQVLGARGRVPRVSSGRATTRRTPKRPPREGP